MEAPGKGIPVAGFDYTKDVHQKEKTRRYVSPGRAKKDTAGRELVLHRKVFASEQRMM